MDGRACATFRGGNCVDGSFLERPGELAAGVGASQPPPSRLLLLPPRLSTLRQPADVRLSASPSVDYGDGAAAAACGSPSAARQPPKRRPSAATAGTRPPLGPLRRLLPTVVADHKRDSGLADRQFFRLKPGPELVRALIDRGAAFARDQAHEHGF
jgi:hypothetical protein